jgi:hypothetical protein
MQQSKDKSLTMPHSALCYSVKMVLSSNAISAQNMETKTKRCGLAELMQAGMHGRGVNMMKTPASEPIFG